MESLLSKISAYHLISYALTGLIVTSSYIVLHGISPNFGPAVTFGAVYLIGLLISRIGSVLMEWPLKKVGFIKYAAYPEHRQQDIRASRAIIVLPHAMLWLWAGSGFFGTRWA
jgi:uncharacterized membrane protein